MTIEFLVDTGACTTCVHPLDAAVRLGLSPHRLADPRLWAKNQHEIAQGVGGSALYYIVSAKYAFMHDDGALEDVSGDVRIAQWRLDNQQMESLLGWDVLKRFSLTLDWSRERVSLNRP